MSLTEAFGAGVVGCQGDSFFSPTFIQGWCGAFESCRAACSACCCRYFFLSFCDIFGGAGRVVALFFSAASPAERADWAGLDSANTSRRLNRGVAKLEEAQGLPPSELFRRLVSFKESGWKSRERESDPSGLGIEVPVTSTALPLEARRSSVIGRMSRFVGAFDLEVVGEPGLPARDGSSSISKMRSPWESLDRRTGVEGSCRTVLGLRVAFSGLGEPRRDSSKLPKRVLKDEDSFFSSSRCDVL